MTTYHFLPHYQQRHLYDKIKKLDKEKREPETNAVRSYQDDDLIKIIHQR